jgi:ribonuclease HI
MVQHRGSFDLFTDGACSGNPGPGGWAFILRDRETGRETEGSGGDPATTNNQMELTGVIEGLEHLPYPTSVTLHSDSQYVVNGLNEWLAAWKARGWRTAGRQPVKNEVLWRRLDELAGRHHITAHWVRGHNDHPENTRCDALAVAAAAAVAGRTCGNR